MIEFQTPADAGGKSTMDQLNEVIKQLSQAQQKYLLAAIKQWIKDDRDYPRIDYCTEVIYSDNQRIASGVTRNISATGMFIEPAGPFSVGREIIMTLEHPKSRKPVKVNGRITRKDKKGIGIKFEREITGILRQL
ncbi:MAG: PilZ domain-containing protein [Desulfobacterales bacterium]|nr:PilZ domain-containing protein [Desulfobacterales bacterium]